MQSRGAQYPVQQRSYANTKQILSDATQTSHQLSKPEARLEAATRRMDDYEYYYNEDYDEDYDDYTYTDKSSSLGRRQGDFSEQEELLELAENNRKLKKEKVTKSGKNDYFRGISFLDIACIVFNSRRR